MPLTNLFVAIMENETKEDVEMIDGQDNVNKMPARSQKVNNFSIDSLLSDNKSSRSDNDNCSVQCSSVVHGGEETFSNCSARFHRYDGNTGRDCTKGSIEEEGALMRSSQSCPSASYSRSFSEGSACINNFSIFTFSASFIYFILSIKTLLLNVACIE